MLLMLLAALLDTAVPTVRITLPDSASTAGPAAFVLPRSHADDEHLRRGYSAMTEGALELARREFIVAAALARADGAVPHTAVHGLARVLFGLDRAREAARVLDELALESLSARDFDGAARAIGDALWLHLRGGRSVDATRDAQILSRLLESGDVSAATRQELRSRFP